MAAPPSREFATENNRGDIHRKMPCWQSTIRTIVRPVTLMVNHSQATISENGGTLTAMVTRNSSNGVLALNMSGGGICDAFVTT